MTTLKLTKIGLINLNKLSLNAIKTKCMFMASRQKLSNNPDETNIAIAGNKIERVRSYKCKFRFKTGREFDMGASCFYYNLQSLQGDWSPTKTKIIAPTVNSCHDL